MKILFDNAFFGATRNHIDRTIAETENTETEYGFYQPRYDPACEDALHLH